MFGEYKRTKKAEEAGEFALCVQKELMERKNMAWRLKVKQYAKENVDAPYVGHQVVLIWASLSGTLKKACFYREALWMGKLAALHSAKLTKKYANIRVEALEAYGLAQIGFMRLEKGIAILEKAWECVKPGIRSYDYCYYQCGKNLSDAYLKAGKYAERQKILDVLQKWIAEEKPSGLNDEELLWLDLDIGNGLLHQGRYQEGILLVEKLEKKVQTLGLQDSPIYYEVLMMQAHFEKMNNRIVSSYNLTKKAISYAQKAGDLSKERAYQANLLDAMDRLGKREEMLSEMYNISEMLGKVTEKEDSINVLQGCMSILGSLCQYPGMEEYLQQLADKAKQAWDVLKLQGADLDSRDSLKVQQQFALVKVCQQKYIEAETELTDCLKRSQRSLGESDMDTLSIMESLAEIKRQEGKCREALGIYLEIEELRKSNGQAETAPYFETLRSIAYVYYGMGEKQWAFERIFLYFDKIDEYSYETFLVFDELAWKRFSYKFTETLRDVLGWMVDSPEMGIKAEQIYGIVLRLKNRIYDEEMLWKAKKQSPYLEPKLAEYYRMLKMPVQFGDEKEQISFLNKRCRLQEEISSYRPDSLKCATSPEELRGFLGKGEVILDYVIYHRGEEKRGEGYLVFCVDGDGIRFYDLGKLRGVDAEMEGFYEAVSCYHCGKDYLEQQLACVKGALGLSDLSGLFPGMAGMKKVYLGLDGEWMPKLPWHYILSEYETHVLPSFAVFGKRAKEGEVPQNADNGVAFFANTKLSFEDERMELSLAIAKTSKISLEKLAGGRLQAYEGAEADRERFLSIHSPNVLHVAVHGYSGLGDGKSRFQGNVMLMSSKEPYTGRLQDLAGYEGAVTMLDVMQMDLAGTKLVVLDSCETGIGDFREDEGVYGFPRAFFIAGAEGVLTCLWKVDALFSVLFLDCFYRSYFADGDMGKALRHSRDAVRKMTVGDVRGWLEGNRGSIVAMENGEEVFAKMEGIISGLGVAGEGEFIYGNPAYLACFTLARAN